MVERDSKGRFVKSKHGAIVKGLLALASQVLYVLCVIVGLVVGVCTAIGALVAFGIYVQGVEGNELPENTCNRRVQVLALPTAPGSKASVFVCKH